VQLLSSLAAPHVGTWVERVELPFLFRWWKPNFPKGTLNPSSRQEQ